MKKTLLLSILTAVTMNAGAQMQQNNVAALSNYLQQAHATAAKKTTAAPPRWYNYGDAMDTSTNHYYGTYNQNTALCAATIWNDTNGTVLDSGNIYRHQTKVCEAVVFDPKAALFNYDPDSAYIGQMLVTGTDAYVLDSVELFGVYLFNPVKTTEVDTIRLVFMTGSGGPRWSDDIYSGFSVPAGPYIGDPFLDMKWDSITNTAVDHNYLVYTSARQDIFLKNSGGTPAWGDTTANGIWDRRIAVNGATGIAVASGGLFAMSITFISGDVSTRLGGILHTATPGDTLVGALSYWKSDNRYNVWCPLVNYYATYSGSIPTPVWPPYQCPAWEIYKPDQNLGYWKTLPNNTSSFDSTFSPTWAQNDRGNPSVLQYPDVSWHVSSCWSCGLVTAIPKVLGSSALGTVNKVNAAPNPSIDELNISFELSDASDITVSLTNMLGQEVATQYLTNTAKGSILFDTKSLSAGLYIYIPFWRATNVILAG